ncbi:hypothetical protein SAMN02799630_04316 [Paenibacillus sp. UNCCL117]|uniref:hypothetical protein n=1 Tax=unclassified Paenibacillus TaxID=185978 RepID=UPI00088AD0B8|nr:MULTISPECIES: hypothetical protein [unclassified Paenibacillus]SDD97677.1 hypothetical protein SAMN04488602_11678 [Paenibacillus sp. cl123]SFW56127.1 hypothetical protein SAMN02799630_04316 [Paenibacillus sp. UNCCL117]
MARLEYRLYAESESMFPVLYEYDRIGRDEAALRFACDYFVKGGRVYEKTSCAVEAHTYVIYVKEASDERTMPWRRPDADGPRGIYMELREYREGMADYRLVETLQFADTLDLMLHMQANYLYAEEREWERMSTEVDEDRETYVFYASPV